MRGILWMGCAGLLASSAGCVEVDQARARNKMAEVRESVRLAELRGVRDTRATRQLQQARAELRDSQGLVQREPYRAISELTCAQADTELAVALEDEARARAEDRRISGSLGTSALSQPSPTIVAPTYVPVQVPTVTPGVIIQ